VGWYVLAITFQAVIFFAAQWLDGLLGNEYSVLSPLESVPYPLAFVIPIMIASAFPGSLAEELGWRGFALPSLQSRFGALFSSILIGLAWGLWHIPSMLYFEMNLMEIGLAVIGTIPLAILYTWLYNNTKGSLLLAVLFHLGQQLSLNLLGSWSGYTDEIMLWIMAILVIAVTGAANLSRRSWRVQWESLGNGKITAGS